MKKPVLFIAVLMLLITIASAQCMLIPVTLNQRVANSSAVIEGKVIDQKYFWDPSHQNIYTSNLVEVYKTFKSTSSTYVEVVTLGGVVGDRILIAEPSLKLGIGDVGVFTLNANSLPSQFGKAVYEAYADVQGFIRYNAAENEANEPFKKYHNIASGLYTEIEQLTNITHTVVKPYNAFYIQTPLSKAAVPVITGFSPTTIPAGTFSVLTINGAGFGATQGSSFVEFPNSNNAGATYIQPYNFEYTSWSDTVITLKVPSWTPAPIGTAGSGLFRVDVGGIKAISPASLTIPYALSNIPELTSPPTLYFPTHVAQTSGGYELIMYVGFAANTAANNAFKRALETWRCNTKINFKSTTVTFTNATAGDYMNIIRFDVGNEMPVGLSGRTSTWASICGSNPNMKWYIDEIDLIFDDGAPWNFSTAQPGATQLDFETIVLHEIGHAHSLFHVIDTTNIMNIFTALGKSIRTLHPNAVAGGNDVMQRNTVSACSQPLMVPLTSANCGLFTGINKSFLHTDLVSVYPNPGTGLFTLELNDQFNINKLMVINALGQTVYSQHNISENNLKIDLKSMPNGVYFLQINTSQGSISQKLIKE